MISNDTIAVSDWKLPRVLAAASKTTALDVIPAVVVQPQLQRFAGNDHHHETELQ
jgi:hypothetical protein